MALLAGSLGLFGWYLSQIELAELRALIWRIGPWTPLVLLPYFLVYLVDCLAWTQTLSKQKPPFIDLLRIRWAGESVNNIIPSAYVAGEAVKVWLLRRKGVDPRDGATSVVVSKTAQTIAQAAFIAVAAAFLFWIAQDR